MKTNRFKMLLLGAAAVISLGAGVGVQAASAQSAPSFSPSTSLPADLQKIYDGLPASIKFHLMMVSPTDQATALRTMQLLQNTEQSLSDPTLLVKSLTPKAQDVFNKLTHDEQTEAMPDIQQGVARTMSNRSFGQDLAQTPPADQATLVRDVMSNIVLYRADKKYNYCNVMLDSEAEIAYSEEGLKKLVAAPRQCPVGPTVDLEATLKYVNQQLACAIGDPAYTRVMGVEEYADMRSETAGTKTAFKGGGLGLNLSMDPALKLPPTPSQLTDFAKGMQERQKLLASGVSGNDPCTDKPVALTDEEVTELKKTPDQPYQAGFSGLIYHVMKNSPAAKAGFVDGDIVVKVDGQSVTGLEADSIVNKMRGDIGTSVVVTVKRGNAEITKTLTREAVLPDNVWSRDLGDGIYAIVVSSFERENTAFMIYDEIQKIKDHARGYVFDVRGNPGGLLDEAVEAVSWFVHDGVILSQRERIQGDPADPQYLKITWSRVGSHVIKETVNEKSGVVVESGIMTLSENDNTGKTLRSFTEIPFLGGKPTVVLANDHSASAAEIFTGGMSENTVVDPKDANTQPQGATFIGVHTYGKFIGQTVMPGPAKTAIKATSFRYFSPKGEWLGDAWKTKIGLTPAIKVEEPKDAIPYTPSDVQLNASKSYLLSALKASAPGATVVKAQTP